MEPTRGGRHCTECCKIVTDFTVMSNEQIINYLSDTTNVCGRMEAWQLNSLNRHIATQKRPIINWKGLSLAASLFFALPVFKSFAQQVQNSHQAVHSKKVADTANKSSLNGKATRKRITRQKALAIKGSLDKVLKQPKRDSLIAVYARFKPQKLNADTSKLKMGDVVYQLPVERLETIVGGVSIITTTIETPPITGIYDWLLQNFLLKF
jgi:hypothetical protein